MKKLSYLFVCGLFLSSQNSIASQDLPEFLEEKSQKTQNNQGWNFSHCGDVEWDFIEWVTEQEESQENNFYYVLTNACAYGRVPYDVLVNWSDHITIIGSELDGRHLEGFQNWLNDEGSKYQKRISLFSGDCLYLEENKHFLEAISDKQAIAISGFNYLHFLDPFTAAQHLVRDFDRLAPGGRAFYLSEGTNFDEEYFVVKAFQNPHTLESQKTIRRMKEANLLWNQKRFCGTNALIRIYEEMNQPFPGYINPSVDNELNEQFFNGHNSLKFSEQTVREMAERIGFNIININYSNNGQKTQSFFQNDKGVYIGFILEKPENYDGETIFEKVEELFGDYQGIDDSRRRLHQENNFVVKKEYPFVFCEDE